MRVLASVALSFSAAIFSAHYLIPARYRLIFAALFLLLGAGAFFIRRPLRLRAVLLAGGLCIGFLWSWGYDAIFIAPAEKLAGEEREITAVAEDYGILSDYGVRVNVRIKTGGAGATAALYIFDEQPDIRPGDVIESTVKLTPASEAFGEETDAYLSRGIQLIASTYDGCTVTSGGFSVKYIPRYTAHALKNMIVTVFPEDSRALMLALMTGDRTLLNDDNMLSEALSKTGIAHIAAVSGMHLSFLMEFIGLFIGKKAKKRAAIGIPAVLFFMAVTGFTPSVTRAGVMQLFVLVAPLARRENDTITSLSFSLALLLLINPFSAGSVGLQLSFAAVAGMRLISMRLNSLCMKKLRASKIFEIKPLYAALMFIISGFATTLGASVFTIPLSALHFGSISLIAPFMNIMTVWAVSAAFIGGFIACIVGFVFAPAGSVVALIVSVIARYVIGLSEWAARLGISSVYTANPYVLIWLVYVYAMFAALLLIKPKPRQLILPVCLAISLLCVSLLVSRADTARSDGDMSVTVLDVGQGLSCVVSSGNATAVIDCGSSSGEDAADIAEDYIHSRGGDTIDILILTHYHDDHVNGVAGLMAACGVRAVAMPEPGAEDYDAAEEISDIAESVGAEIIYVTGEMRVSLGTASMRLFPPLGEKDNERGVSVLASDGEYDALITGDMGSATEKRLISSFTLPDIETLVVGHHGSAYSTSPELLYAVSPETAVISVGDNSYGHPAEALLDRLFTFGIEVYRTDESGSLTFKGERDG